MARRDITVRIRRLHDEEDDDPLRDTTVEQRLALVWTLTREGWTLTRRPWPSYDRRESPISVRRLGSSPIE